MSDGIFGDQALRLLRDDWPSAKTLAEELYAIFTSTHPTTLNGPVTINNSSNQPDLTTNNYGSGPGGITINKQPFPPAPPVPGFPPPQFGDINFTTYFADGTTAQSPENPPQPTPDTGSSSFPAKVLSGGPGAGPYAVSVYKKGLAAAPTPGFATQLSIDPGETIPADTFTVVILVGTTYYMQVPVWGPP